ncbi:MAG: AAA family ATPase [Candidatus Muirbacterium halophilum]|nr:AAA family ATPase [Candidatus Muirbacterium halophilum]
MSIWYVAEDVEYYKNAQNKKDIFSQYNEVIQLPSTDEIRKLFAKEQVAFISNHYPPKEFLNIFVIKYLENKFGILTTQEKENKIDIATSIEVKLGLKTVHTKLSFINLAGADSFKNWTKYSYLKMKQYGLSIKPVIMIGVPGVGKSYSVACFAGEFGLPLMQLNLSAIAETAEPIRTLNKVFEYFEQNGQECVLLIDEIEQMLENETMTGALLTIFNDLNTDQGFKFNGMIFATSNNITKIALEKPQFFRHGRWSEKFFVNYPQKEEALNVMKLYRDKYNISYINNGLIELIYVKANQIYKEYNINETRSVYANSEIAYLYEKMSLYDSIDDFCLDGMIKSVEPLQKTTHIAIHKLLQDAKQNSFLEM